MQNTNHLFLIIDNAIVLQLNRIRDSSDPLDLPWIGQLDRSDCSADGTFTNYFTSTSRSHASLYNLQKD